MLLLLLYLMNLVRRIELLLHLSCKHSLLHARFFRLRQVHLAKLLLLLRLWLRLLLDRCSNCARSTVSKRCMRRQPCGS